MLRRGARGVVLDVAAEPAKIQQPATPPRPKTMQQSHADDASSEDLRGQEIGLEYLTLVAFIKLHGLQISRDQLGRFGTAAVRLSRNKKVPVKKLPDKRFQFVNAYSVEVLAEVFSGSSNPATPT